MFMFDSIAIRLLPCLASLAGLGVMMTCGAMACAADQDAAASSSAKSSPAEYPRGELLIEASDLRDNLKDFVVLDARDAQAYAAGHIPGALHIDAAAWSKDFGDGDDAELWSRRIAELGIAADTPVALYDDNLLPASRAWWILRYWGVRQPRLLNGGFKSWQAANGPVSQESPEPATKTTFKARPQADRLADKGEVLAGLKNPQVQIVDARSENEFCGLDKRNNLRGGAIPGARHLEWTDLLDSQTQRFKSADELHAIFRQAGVDLNKPAVTHCQSGGRASVMAFGMELMGARDVANYYRGWSEWGNDDATPIEPGKKKREPKPKSE